MSDVLNCGVLGAGWWATTAHLPALVANSRARVLAVQTRTREGAEKIARDFNVKHAVTTVEEMVQIRGIQAVVDASTPNMHYHNAKICLEHGLHVLMEKPMSITAAQAGELVELAKAKRLQLLIDCPWHYTAHAAEARRLVGAGLLGRLKLVSMLFTNFSGPLYRERNAWKEYFTEGAEKLYFEPYITPEQKSYSDPAVSGGGQIYGQVSHAAAFLGLLTASDPTEVFAHFDNAELKIDVYDALCIKLRDGCLVTLASTGDTMYSRRQFEVRAFGTEGMLLLELWKGTMEFHPRKGDVVVYPTIEEKISYPMHDPANNLVDAALGRAENRSPGTLGFYAMKIIEAACMSARSGRNVLVDSDLHLST
jgi:predicted dehydrogenase